MAKDDLHLVRELQLGDHGKDVLAVKRALSHARVDFPMPVRQGGKFNDRFGPKMDAAVKRFQRRRDLDDDGRVGYMTFTALVKHVDAFGSKLLRDFAKAQIGDWGLIGRKTAFKGIDTGVDFKGKGPIPMFADGKVVRVVRSKSGWPGEGGLIVVECDKGPMSRHPIYTAEDIAIPASHTVGKRLAKGELLATATGSNKAPGIELGWAGKGPAFFGTLFHEKHGKYTMNPRVTAEGTDFWKTLSAWMAKGM
jgi:Putative peptidoglycan binding domain